MAKVLVTGGAGFIGSHVVDLLVQENHQVVVVDNFFTGKEQNIEHLKDKITVFKEDIRNLEGLKKAFEGVEFVLHQAALRSVPTSIKEPEQYIDVNVKGTLNVLEAARLTAVKKVIFASSSSVYGTAKKLPLKEGKESIKISPYAITKHVGEDLCKYYYKIYGLETVSLRYFNVFGPRQDPHSPYAAVIPLFIKAVLNDQQPTIFGDGEQTRDFTYIENAAKANLLAMKIKKARGKVFNIANQEGISVNTILQKINNHLGKNISAKYDPPRLGDMKHTIAENSKAKKILGYQNFVPFEDGLKKTIDWMKSLQNAQTVVDFTLKTQENLG